MNHRREENTVRIDYAKVKGRRNQGLITAQKLLLTSGNLLIPENQMLRLTTLTCKSDVNKIQSPPGVEGLMGVQTMTITSSQ